MIDLPVADVNYFTAFENPLSDYLLPDRFTYPFAYTPHALSLLAAAQLQVHLENQKDWVPDFGLINAIDTSELGKMFGVLVVTTAQNEIGYLSAFSGKLAGGNHHPKFVPPVFDTLLEGGFVSLGMKELTHMTNEINTLLTLNLEEHSQRILVLKKARKEHSTALQDKIFEQYIFLNQAGVEKSLLAIFETTIVKKPQSGAGECAAPKLLQYAFSHNMKPIALAEFWWGSSPKSELRKHGSFYPSCLEKCKPILGHMLEGMELEAALEQE